MLLLRKSARLAALTIYGALLTAPAVAADASPQGEASTPETAIKKVCTECHTLEVVMDTPKDYDTWHTTVQQMIDRGAQGTQDEFGLVMQFLYENMTTVNVNTADEEDLMTILRASKPAADAVIARRAKRPFKDLADLESMPGLDRSVLESKKRMIFF